MYLLSLCKVLANSNSLKPPFHHVIKGFRPTKAAHTPRVSDDGQPGPSRLHFLSFFFYSLFLSSQQYQWSTFEAVADRHDEWHLSTATASSQRQSRRLSVRLLSVIQLPLWSLRSSFLRIPHAFCFSELQKDDLNPPSTFSPPSRLSLLLAAKRLKEASPSCAFSRINNHSEEVVLPSDAFPREMRVGELASFRGKICVYNSTKTNSKTDAQQNGNSDDSVVGPACVLQHLFLYFTSSRCSSSSSSSSTSSSSSSSSRLVFWTIGRGSIYWGLFSSLTLCCFFCHYFLFAWYQLLFSALSFFSFSFVSNRWSSVGL